MGQWLYPIQLDPMTNKVFEDSRLGRFVARIQSIVPNLGAPRFLFFQPVHLFLKPDILLLVRGNLGLNDFGEGIKTPLGFGGQKRSLAIGKLRRRKNGHHSVIITGRNGIELMIVTLCALHGMGKKSLPTESVTSSNQSCLVSLKTLMPVCSHGPMRRNPVATRFSGFWGSISSPATCSFTNWSKGLSSLKERTT